MCMFQLRCGCRYCTCFLCYVRRRRREMMATSLAEYAHDSPVCQPVCSFCVVRVVYGKHTRWQQVLAPEGVLLFFRVGWPVCGLNVGSRSTGYK